MTKGAGQWPALARRDRLNTFTPRLHHS